MGSDKEKVKIQSVSWLLVFFLTQIASTVIQYITIYFLRPIWDNIVNSWVKKK
jgi:hypothetical protein